jgi:hypothetical protein
LHCRYVTRECGDYYHNEAEGSAEKAGRVMEYESANQEKDELSRFLSSLPPGQSKAVIEYIFGTRGNLPEFAPQE